MEATSCPCCGSYALVALCHLPPDPLYICDGCSTEFDGHMVPLPLNPDATVGGMPVAGEGV